MGILAVVGFVIALLAYQFLPASNAPANAVQVDQLDQAEVEIGDDAGSATIENGFDTEVVYDWIIDVDELPDEAFDTLLLIDANGPYPYSKDGTTFQNRERLLPSQPGNYYQEFTVDTPGLDHRGAKRIVAGADGELFWTDDHYDSFAQIVGWSGG